MKKTITYKEIKDKVLDIINNGGGGGGKSKLSELTDVTITSASADQVLKYNGTKWVNGTAGGGYVTPQLIASNLTADDTFTVPNTVNRVTVLIRTNGEDGGNYWYHEFDNNILPDGSLNFDCLWDNYNGCILMISKEGNTFTIDAPLYTQGVVNYNFTIYGV